MDRTHRPRAGERGARSPRHACAGDRGSLSRPRPAVRGCDCLQRALLALPADDPARLHLRARAAGRHASLAGDRRAARRPPGLTLGRGGRAELDRADRVAPVRARAPLPRRAPLGSVRNDGGDPRRPRVRAQGREAAAGRAREARRLRAGRRHGRARPGRDRPVGLRDAVQPCRRLGLGSARHRRHLEPDRARSSEMACSSL